MNVALVVALVAGVFGVAGTVLASVLASRQAATARAVNLLDQKQKDAADEARHERQEDRDARRDYNYKAQIRLYEMYEPLRFQLVHASARALRRISEVSMGAPPAALPGESTETATNYLFETAYDLLAPLALVQQVEQQMTLVDLHVDRQAALEFWLAKGLTDVMSDDVIVARMDPPLPYSPYVKNWQTLKEKDPQQYRRQGLDPGELESVLALFVTTTPADTRRLRSSGEFMAALHEDPRPDGTAELGRLFDGFTPQARPVLWRILVTQALLYGCFLTVAIIGPPPTDRVPQLGEDHAELLAAAAARRQRLDLDWKAPLDGCTDVDADAVLTALPAAVAYYRRRVAPASRLIWSVAAAA